MSPTIKKFSGPALDRYLERFFAAEPGLSGEASANLARRASAAFSSVRVRPGFEAPKVARVSALRTAAATPAPSTTRPAAAPSSAPTSAPAAKPIAPDPMAGPAVETGEFDAYAIGLVPTFQREGRDGLIARLGSVTSTDNLRKMARAQQIVLPEPMRQSGVAIDNLRAAIADAVAKRIADRRAAAG